MTPRPHDALFKRAFKSPTDAASLLRQLMPLELRDAIVWSSLKIETGSFVDALLADRHNDLLFTARLRTGARDILYLLLEHQSTRDPGMPLRILSYDSRLWDHFRDERPRALLPPITATVVSHVPGGWSVSPDFAVMFKHRVLATIGLAPLVPQFSLIIEDLTRRTNEEIQAWSMGAFQKLALWLLRDARKPSRLLAQFAAWIDEWNEVEQDLLRPDAFGTLIRYVFHVVDPRYRDALRAKLALLGSRAKESAMTIAEQLHEEGRQQGHQEGRQQGHQEGRQQGHQEGREEGRQEGREEGRQQALVAAVRQLLIGKFHALEARDEVRLSAATLEALDRYLQRVLSASSPADVFGD